jgi:hypothetical protein
VVAIHALPSAALVEQLLYTFQGNVLLSFDDHAFAHLKKFFCHLAGKRIVGFELRIESTAQ